MPSIQVGDEVIEFPDSMSEEEIAAALQQVSPPETLEGQLQAIDGGWAGPVVPPETDAWDYVQGALSTGADVVGGLVGTVGGSIEGIGRSVAEGTFGTPQGAQDAWQTVQTRQQQLSHQPDDPAVQEAKGQIQEGLEPLTYFTDPLAGHIPGLSGPAPAVGGRLGHVTAPYRKEMTHGGRSAGAAEASAASQRAATAADLPIPMTGEAAPTLGQLTRNQQQLRFERETAKDDEVGGPLRNRYAAQAENMNRNLDNLDQRFDTRLTEDRDIGQAAAEAVAQRRKDQRVKVDEAYTKAREAGELDVPVTLGDMDDILLETRQLLKLAPNAGPILKEARRVGILNEDNVPQPVSLNDMETFRQFVNVATDDSSKQQRRFRRLWTDAVDETIDATDTGPLYNNARQQFNSWKREFDETPITADVIRLKRGTEERAVPYENVFKNTMLKGSVEEINKLRGTLLRGGEDGQQTWTDLKARFARHIAERARTSSTMANDAPVISPKKFADVVIEMDRRGKLEAIFGKRQAQEIRDMKDTVHALMTAPPDTVNYSGTASQIANLLKRAAGSKLTLGIGGAVQKAATRRDVGAALDLRDAPGLQGILETAPDPTRGVRGVFNREMERVREMAQRLRNREEDL